MYNIYKMINNYNYNYNNDKYEREYFKTKLYCTV